MFLEPWMLYIKFNLFLEGYYWNGPWLTLNLLTFTMDPLHELWKQRLIWKGSPNGHNARQKWKPTRSPHLRTGWHQAFSDLWESYSCIPVFAGAGFGCAMNITRLSTAKGMVGHALPARTIPAQTFGNTVTSLQSFHFTKWAAIIARSINVEENVLIS